MKIVFAFFAVWFLSIVPAGAKPVLNVQTVVSTNKIKAWYVQDKTLPIVSLSFAFRSGTVNEPLNKQGRLQLLSTMLDEGAGNLNAHDFQKELKDKSISLSFRPGRDALVGELKYIKRYEKTALQLLKLALTEPHFAEDSLQRMVAANSASLKSNLNDPVWASARLLMNASFANHPYRQNVMGTLQTLSALTAADLHAVKNQLFTRSNLVVAVAGDVSENTLAKMLDNVFGALPEGVTYTMPTKAVQPAAAKALYYPLSIPQTAINMAWPALDMQDPDWSAQTVLNYIFAGGGFSARLMQLVRNEDALTYGIDSSVEAYDAATRLVVSSNVQSSGIGRVVKLVHQTTQDLMNTPVPEAELSAAKNYLLGAQVIAFSSTSRISGAMLAWQLNGRGPNYAEEWADRIAKVNAIDVQRTAQRLFATQPLVTLAGGAPNVPYTLVKELPNVSQPTP